MRLLIVDDEPNLRKMMKLMIRSCGLEVLEAANGAEALRTQADIDVLITDIVMDEMDGWAVARSLAKRNPELAVLFVSGFPADFETASREFARCSFLRKPFSKSELMAAIASLSGVAV